jgi:hypothetical protein
MRIKGALDSGANQSQQVFSPDTRVLRPGPGRLRSDGVSCGLRGWWVQRGFLGRHRGRLDQFFFLHSNSALDVERLDRFTLLLPTWTASSFRGAKATRHLHRFNHDTQASPQVTGIIRQKRARDAEPPCQLRYIVPLFSCPEGNHRWGHGSQRRVCQVFLG